MRLKTFGYTELAVGQKLYTLIPVVVFAKNIFWSVRDRNYKTFIVAVQWLNYFRGIKIEWKVKKK